MYEYDNTGKGWKIQARDGHENSYVGNTYNDDMVLVVIQPYCRLQLFEHRSYGGRKHTVYGEYGKKAPAKSHSLGSWIRNEMSSYKCHCRKWVRGALNTCNKSCGGGKQTQKYTCKNWQDKYTYNCATQSDPGKYGYTAEEVQISRDCNTFACGK